MNPPSVMSAVVGSHCSSSKSWPSCRTITPHSFATSLVAMFWYNALVTPLAWTLLSYALLWRNETQHNREAMR